MSQIVRWMFQLSVPLNTPTWHTPHTQQGLLRLIWQTWLTITISSPLDPFFLWGAHPVKDPWNFLSQIVFVPIYETYIGYRQPLFLQNLQDRAFQSLNARASDPRRKLVSMKHLPATKSRATKLSRAEAIGATNAQTRNIQLQKTECVSRYSLEMVEEKYTSFLRRKSYAVDDAVASVSQRMNLQRTLWESRRTLLGEGKSSAPNDRPRKHNVWKRSKMASSNINTILTTTCQEAIETLKPGNQNWFTHAKSWLFICKTVLKEYTSEAIPRYFQRN